MNSILSMVKPYKIGDSVICDNLISIETRGKSKPFILKSSSVLLQANHIDQNTMANETATVVATAPINIVPGMKPLVNHFRLNIIL